MTRFNSNNNKYNNNNNRRYLIALNKIPAISSKHIFKLIKFFPDLKLFFNLSSYQMERFGFSSKVVQAIKKFDFKTLEEEQSWEEKEKQYILTWEDPDYPSLLKEIADPPAVLYAKGNLSCLQNATLAIVGSRKPSISGSEMAYRFAFELAPSATIVSGLALGVDTQAHQGCLKANGNTIAVLGTGIDVIYPRQNQHLAEEIAERGLILSEFPLKTSPIARHFPQRNRIISGLSLAVLVVEAAIKSGSLITAQLALEQNRDVLAIPGSILNPQAKGCHYLLQQGATLVTSAEDVLDGLGLESKQLTKTKSKAVSLDSNGHKLLNVIGYEVTTFDQVLQRSGLSLETIAGELALMELEEIIKSVPGGYIRCV